MLKVTGKNRLGPCGNPDGASTWVKVSASLSPPIWFHLTAQANLLLKRVPPQESGCHRIKVSPKGVSFPWPFPGYWSSMQLDWQPSDDPHRPCEYPCEYRVGSGLFTKVHPQMTPQINTWSQQAGTRLQCVCVGGGAKSTGPLTASPMPLSSPPCSSFETPVMTSFQEGKKIHHGCAEAVSTNSHQGALQPKQLAGPFLSTVSVFFPWHDRWWGWVTLAEACMVWWMETYLRCFNLP